MGLAITTDNPLNENAVLFGRIGGYGEVKNLQLVNVDFNVIQYGVSGGIAVSNYGTITACWFNGTLSGQDAMGGTLGGGITVFNYDTVTACYWSGNATWGVYNNSGGTADTYQIDTGTSWQPAVDGMNPALTGNDYQWVLGTDDLPVLQKKQ